jgi:membrane fusion protein, multidrug efflux system
MRTVKKLVIILLAFAGLVVILLWMASTFRDQVEPTILAQPRNDTPINATGVIHMTVQEVVEEAVGSLRAERRTMISSKILATISKVHVKAGDKVDQGQLLFVLDDRDLKAALEQADEHVSSQEAQLKRAKTAYERQTELLANGATTKSIVDRSEEEYQTAKANLQKAKKAVEAAQISMTYAKVTSPVAGTAVDRLAEPGDMAAPGRPLISIYDPTALRLEAPVREMLATKLKIGDILKVRIDALNLTLEGRVDEIVPEAEASSRSFLVKVGIPKHEGLYSGMFGRIVIPAGKRNRVCMPKAALQQIGQLEFIDVVTDDNQVQRRLIKTGEHNLELTVEVLSGASPGDVVLLHGQNK